MKKHSFQSSRITRTLLWSLVALAVGVFALLLTAVIGSSSGSSIQYSSLNYAANVLDNGDLKVTQKITVHLDEQDNDAPWRQLYQQYSDAQIPGEITDISVIGDDGEKFMQTDPLLPSDADDEGIDWDSEMADTWYINNAATDNDGNSVEEIGWNIPATDSAEAMNFTITMTFTNAVVAHPDVAEFQWEPISAANSIPIDHLSGTLTFPKGISTSNSWAWLHYEGSNSTTSRTTDGGLKFSATNVWGGNYVAIRAMFDSSAVTTSRTSNTDAKQRIMDEEATKEENWYSQQQSAARIRLIVWIILAVLILLLSVFALIQAIRTNRGAQYHGNLDYWREPPEMSPAAAAHLLHVMDPSKGKSKDILTATILSLATKKAIVLLPGGVTNYLTLKPVIEDPSASPASVYSSAPKPSPVSAEETTTIAILPAALDRARRAQLHLSASEDNALGVLLHISQAAGRPTFDLKELKDLFKDNDDEAENVNNSLLSLASSGTREFDALHATSSSIGTHLTSVILLMMLSIASIIVFGATGQLVLGACIGVVGLVIATVALVWGSDVVLNEKGQELAGTVIGLRNYLLDFSTFQDRGVADLALWDRYLVYAAAFGISREVAKQLALAQPQVADQQWLDSNAMTYPLVYSFYRPLSFGGGVTAGSTIGNGFSMGDIGSQISSNIGDIQSTISTAMSSGSGSSGGSFGGGGFGGGGGGVGGGSFGGR